MKEENSVLVIILLTSAVVRKLIIELDGDPYKIIKDEIRDNYLASLGLTVLRFENKFIFQEPEYIKREIRKVYNKKGIEN